MKRRNRREVNGETYVETYENYILLKAARLLGSLDEKGLEKLNKHMKRIDDWLIKTTMVKIPVTYDTDSGIETFYINRRDWMIAKTILDNVSKYIV